MTPTKALEYRISQARLRGSRRSPGWTFTRVADAFVRGLAAIVVIAVVGMQFPELVWAGLAGSIVYSLGLA